MHDQPVLFHVGYHKTGTTWMQRRLFVNDYGYDQIVDQVEVDRLVVAPHRLDFDPARAQRLIEARRPKRDFVPVVSSELLVDNPISGGRESADYAQRLHAVDPEARILLTIRAQVSAITAVYMQYVRRGGTLSPRSFLSSERVPGYNVFDPVHFEYDRLVSLYQRCFGSEKVLVLTQEHLSSDPRGFVNKLARFSGASLGATPSTVREGVSESEAAAATLRIVNRVRNEALNPNPVLDLGSLSHTLYRATGWAFRKPFVRKLTRENRAVSAVAEDLFGGRFTASNRRLEQLCPGLDLTGYER